MELGGASAQPGHRRLSDNEGVGETEVRTSQNPGNGADGEERDGKPALAIGKDFRPLRIFRSRRRPRFIFKARSSVLVSRRAIRDCPHRRDRAP
jgi:hypothetical protein